MLYAEDEEDAHERECEDEETASAEYECDSSDEWCGPTEGSWSGFVVPVDERHAPEEEVVVGVEVEGTCPFHVCPLPECGVLLYEVPGDE